MTPPNEDIQQRIDGYGPRVDRQSYHGPRGPTHPYALYTQNTTTNEEPEEQTPPNHIPVGFTGMGASYRRQIGPDGEEAGDLIGPLGHLEELPPYTRYAEDSFARKSPEPVANLSPSPVQPIPGAGGIGIATRDPEFSSTEDDLGMPSRPVSRSESHHEVNTAAREYSEKKTMTKWQRRARRKLWGIVPYWSIFLLLVSIVIMGIVMGAVIGTVLVGHNRDNGSPGDEQPDMEPTGTPSDVRPLTALPTGLPPLATGYFSLPPLDTSQAPKSCFVEPTQAQAWSCDMPFRFYSMDIRQDPKAPQTCNYELTLTAFKPSTAKFIWGTQPPDVPDPQSLQLVEDNFERGRGPAWWLSLTYNKTVIVSEEAFPGQKSKRNWHYFDTPMAGIDPTRFKKKNVGAKEGDKPWICTWPNTSLEIFVYPSQNASSSTKGKPSATTTASIDNATPTGDAAPDHIPAYPKVVKFLERRYKQPNSTAVCRQVQVTDNGHGVQPLFGSDGKPIEVTIAERRRGLDETLMEHDRYGQRDKRFPTSFLSREALELTDCGCLWWST
ncbi:hypothetical protein ACCO45_004202 [Purpureocillium lilacinum]|uniref:Uncharacterized protein n=1 Tax=Purpureocillium lilacinum TaxID=33203 RepID=A0ACC4E3G4_PURLI